MQQGWIRVWEDESQAPGGLHLAGSSLHNSIETSRFSTRSGYILNGQQELSPHHVNGNSFTEKMRYSTSHYREDPSSVTFLHLPNKPWDKQVVHGDQLLSKDRDYPRLNHALHYNVKGTLAVPVFEIFWVVLCDCTRAHYAFIEDWLCTWGFQR